eukprot:7390082-Prymnesium_polylepis.1
MARARRAIACLSLSLTDSPASRAHAAPPIPLDLAFGRSPLCVALWQTPVQPVLRRSVTLGVPPRSVGALRLTNSYRCM